MPEAIMNSIRSASPPPVHDAAGFAAELRQRVPTVDHTMFDTTLGDARAVMDMRDDNGPLTIEWPIGLLRRALLAAGSRLVDRGVLSTAELLFEIDETEVHAIFSACLLYTSPSPRDS